MHIMFSNSSVKHIAQAPRQMYAHNDVTVEYTTCRHMIVSMLIGLSKDTTRFSQLVIGRAVYAKLNWHLSRCT